MNAMSLDANYMPTIRDASVANLHERLRDLVELSQAGAPSTPPIPADDLAATELFGTLDNWKSAKWIVRIHVVACADDDGQRKSNITKAQVQQGIEMADKVFELAHLRFAFDPAKDWEELNNTKINRWDIVDHDKNATAFAMKGSRQSKIVLFSAWGPDPATANGGAANGGTHIWLPTDGFDPPGLCHELGHFLGRLEGTVPQSDNQDLTRLIVGQIPWSASSGEFIIVGKVRTWDRRPRRAGERPSWKVLVTRRPRTSRWARPCQLGRWRPTIGSSSRSRCRTGSLGRAKPVSRSARATETRRMTRSAPDPTRLRR